MTGSDRLRLFAARARGQACALMQLAAASSCAERTRRLKADAFECQRRAARFEGRALRLELTGRQGS